VQADQRRADRPVRHLCPADQLSDGAARLRITPSPHHTDADIEHLVQALAEIWAEVGLAKAA
jgi:7-keto-8-aminopelargonate synthetase-like enzyme